MLSEIHEKMTQTFQFKNINMLEHGQMVHEHYQQLILKLKNEEDIFIPLSASQKLWLLDNQYSIEDMQNYHIYHDCGKPFCLEIDSEGRKHFPQHAKVSYEWYMKCFNNELIGNLIAHDMHFHTLKSDLLQTWLEQYKEMPIFLASLYLTALSEISANSSMFGGYETDSFKIKKKHLVKAGNKLFSLFKV